MNTKLLILILLKVYNSSGGPYFYRESYKSDVIYQIVTDRFFDGNTQNNDPSESPHLYDPTKTEWKLYWGGDFAGIERKLMYLRDLGITALWISPPIDNTNVMVSYVGIPNGAYHGYWARDFQRPEEHFGTWAEFDSLVAAAHRVGMKIVLDWAPNHTSPADPLDPSFAEMGAIYNNGDYVADYVNDTHRWFHHNGGIEDWDDAYESQYLNIADLADFDHSNALVNDYMRESLLTWIKHGIDGIRVDAIKHMTRGWQTAMADQVNSLMPMFMFGEWYLQDFKNPLYTDAIRFSNESGISQLDFLLNRSLRDTFIFNHTFQELEDALRLTETDYAYEHNLVTFIDNHDMPRFLTENNQTSLLHLALAFLFTVRGTPCVYYGLEQYLHNDTSGGSDPWNRPMMKSFDTTTTAFRLIKILSALKQGHPALQFGQHQLISLDHEMYVYERTFGTSVVLVAINKSDKTHQLTELQTQLPKGVYDDQLYGLLKGYRIDVDSNRKISINLPPGSASIWSYIEQESAFPIIGSVAPVQFRSGNRVAIDGSGFGNRQGTVSFGHTPSLIETWSNNRVLVTVPNITAGHTDVTVTLSNGSKSNSYSVRVLSGPQIPVTFIYNNIPVNNDSHNRVYLSGNVFELGNWSSDPKVVQGPMFLSQNGTQWFFTVSLPASTNIQFKYFVINNNIITWEQGTNRTYTVPANGVGKVVVERFII
ncbi:unnamed protein product [Didymodactylos carnosus]|uniref:alpha-amylase n=1 Tax=Didymodactylos carnosus TaxID=1234261 RepID=A0A814LVI4_9BILA|nr:unnamed protein product [Didymodactylos carnosus]CAF1298499.1 unnamed protein product [Didymodactylos carnosus]CAF3836621.1 unnamed protein product [Didymodactylos carnosus]CAF4104142.1 unnamed protein product [Didymodactylos carnosus]